MAAEKRIKLFQVDAFADAPFRGNPAAVCPLDEWSDDALLQSIASENNLSETAFFVRTSAGRYDLRWFTPTVEIKLCGHATLASAFVIFNHLEPACDKIIFNTLSGDLAVEKDGNRLRMNFPSYSLRPVDDGTKLQAISDAIGVPALELLHETQSNGFHCIVVESVKQVEHLIPKLGTLQYDLGIGFLIVTATGDPKYDFVSRVFVPEAGIAEDPVTGAAHACLTPFWSKRLAKRKLVARQASNRGGTLWLEDLGDRVAISGHAVLFLKADIYLTTGQTSA